MIPRFSMILEIIGMLVTASASANTQSQRDGVVRRPEQALLVDDSDQGERGQERQQHPGHRDQADRSLVSSLEKGPHLTPEQNISSKSSS